jgi:uncharacterized membrane-anchored protein/membrane-associated phospholipid phosphatase
MSSLNRTSGTPPIGAFFGALGLVFVVLTGVIIRSTWQNQPLPIDSWWHDLLAAHRNALADAGARLLNVFGGTWSMVAVVAIVIAVLLLRRRWREALRIGVTVAAASGASTVLKVLIARPRPLDGIVDTGSDSFPSGHTATAAALTVAIALAFPHVWSWVLAAAWVPVMAVSRTYLLVHWPTDVLAGAVYQGRPSLSSSLLRSLRCSERPRNATPSGHPNSHCDLRFATQPNGSTPLMTATLPDHVRTILFNRVPEVTVAFWVIKILSTTAVETAADYLNSTLGLGLAITSWIMTGLLVIALIAQFATKRYTSGIYWTVVVLISVVGTLLTDTMTDSFGVPLWLSTVAFSALLAVTFGIWFARERTLSIHTIFTRRRETFYWVAILFTFALGTAAGDLITEGFGLGYLFGTLLFAGLIGVIAIARFTFRVNVVFCFWAAYVLTRPLGASMGDLLSQAPADGGLGLGTTVTSVIFLGIISGVATYLGIKVGHQRRVAASAKQDAVLAAA